MATTNSVSYVINIPADVHPSAYIIQAIDTNNFKRRRCASPQPGCHVSCDNNGHTTVVVGSNVLDKHRGCGREVFSDIIRPKLNVH